MKSGMGNPIFIALDVTPYNNAVTMLRKLVQPEPLIGGVKIGMELYYHSSHQQITALMGSFGLGLPLFLDLKLHDIPHQMCGALRQLVDVLSFHYITLHVDDVTQKNIDGLRLVSDFVRDLNLPKSKPRPKLLGVTKLTHLDATCEQIVSMARVAVAGGLDGIICSGHEAAAVRRACGPDFIIFTPGIREAAVAGDDQNRVMTARQALLEGATRLVVGRPLTAAADPRAVAQTMLFDVGRLS